MPGWRLQHSATQHGEQGSLGACVGTFQQRTGLRAWLAAPTRCAASHTPPTARTMLVLALRRQLGHAALGGGLAHPGSKALRHIVDGQAGQRRHRRRRQHRLRLGAGPPGARVVKQVGRAQQQRQRLIAAVALTGGAAALQALLLCGAQRPLASLHQQGARWGGGRRQGVGTAAGRAAGGAATAGAASSIDAARPSDCVAVRKASGDGACSESGCGSNASWM